MPTKMRITLVDKLENQFNCFFFLVITEGDYNETGDFSVVPPSK